MYSSGYTPRHGDLEKERKKERKRDKVDRRALSTFERQVYFMRLAGNRWERDGAECVCGGGYKVPRFVSKLDVCHCEIADV